MIIMKLKGGLANQMFQYAFGRALSLDNHDSLFFDLSAYERTGSDKSTWPYTVNCYNISANEGLSWFANKRLRAMRKHKGLSNKLLSSLFPVYTLNEAGFEYQANIANFKPGSSRILDGYWQSEKYFRHHRNTLLKDFTLNAPICSRSKMLLERIQASNSVAIHIRRGDYVTNPSANAVHGTCTLEYYQHSISYMEQKLPEPVFYFFSDDMDWVKQNFGANDRFVFTDSIEIIPAEEDLLLISTCKHQIIANSSFSWWGAWLNRNSQKIVIAPQQWFRDEKMDTRDLIPDDWLKF
jgi:hypothetical protein